MYSGVSDYHVSSKSPASWLTIISATPVSNYYGLIHNPDPVANGFTGIPTYVTGIWINTFGMTGPLTVADSLSAPYGNSHTLTTNLCSLLSDNDQHNCPLAVSQKAVWDYISFP